MSKSIQVFNQSKQELRIYLTAKTTLTKISLCIEGDALTRELLERGIPNIDLFFFC